VPILGGLDPHRLSSLRATFWLVNIGNAMRVLFQILTDSQAWAYPLMGLSAWIEVTGLTLWAIDLWRAMGSRPAAVSVSGPVEIGPQTNVYDVIHTYPGTKVVFQKYGFSLIDNAVAQRVFARSLSLEQVCRLKHVDFAGFQSELKRAVRDQASDGGSLVQIEEP
jgi:Domain of unknown function (DUF1858)